MTTVKDIYQNSEKWLRLITLIDYAGTQLCKETLHTKEGLPYNGAQLYCKLIVYKDKMQFNEQKEILCPPNGMTDENKFDITLYTNLIQVMFKSKYDALINDLRKKRNHLHHMANKDMSETDFESEWSSTCAMLQRHGFNRSVEDLKIGNLLSNKNLEKILNFIESQTQGNVYVLSSKLTH